MTFKHIRFFIIAAWLAFGSATLFAQLPAEMLGLPPDTSARYIPAIDTSDASAYKGLARWIHIDSLIGDATVAASFVIVDDFTALKALVTSSNFAFVTDSLWGGYFYNDPTVGTPDSALIVDGAGSREWVRIVEDNRYWLTWWINNDTTWEDEIQRAIDLISDRHGEYGTGTLYIPYVDTPLVSDTYTYWLDTVGTDPFDTFDIKDVKYCVELKSNLSIIIDERATLKLIDSLVVFGDSTNRVNIFIADSIQNVSITGGTIDGNASGQYQEAPGYYGHSHYGNAFQFWDSAEVRGNEYIQFQNTKIQNHSGNAIYFRGGGEKIRVNNLVQSGLVDSAAVHHIHEMYLYKVDSTLTNGSGFWLQDSTQYINNPYNDDDAGWIISILNPIQQNEGSVPYITSLKSTLFAGSDRRTHSRLEGFNMIPGGQPLIAGETGYGIASENHFSNSGSILDEWMIWNIDKAPQQRRPFSLIMDQDDPTNWFFGFQMPRGILYDVDTSKHYPYITLQQDSDDGGFIRMTGTGNNLGAQIYVNGSEDRMNILNDGMTTPHMYLFKTNADGSPVVSFVHTNYLQPVPSGNAGVSLTAFDGTDFLTEVTWPVAADSIYTHLDDAGSLTGNLDTIFHTSSTGNIDTVIVTASSDGNGIYDAANENTDAAVTNINIANGNDLRLDFIGTSSADRFILNHAIPSIEFDENDDGVDWLMFQDAGQFTYQPEGGDDNWRINNSGGGALYQLNTSNRAISHFGGTYSFDHAGFSTDPVINFIKDNTRTAEIRWLNGSYLQKWGIIGTAASDMDLRFARYDAGAALVDYPMTLLNSDGVVRILNSGGAATTLTGRDTDEGITDVTIGDFLDLTTGTLSVDTTGFYALYSGGGGTSDHDFYEVGGTSPPNNIGDNIFKSPGTTHFGGTGAAAQTVQITGTARITASDGTATTIMGRDADGDISAVTVGAAFTMAANTLNWNGLLISGDAGSVTLNSTGTLAGGLGLASSGTGTTMTVNMNIGELDTEAAPEGDEMIVVYDANDSPTHEQLELDEAVSDVVGAMVTGNTETAISVTYDDADNTLDFVVSEVDGSTTNEAWTIDADAGGTEVISNQTVLFQGASGISTSYDAGTGILLIDAAAVTGGVTIGTDNQVPFSNAGGTDFDYDADFTFNGTDLAIGSTDLYVDGAGNMVGINDATPDHNLDIHQASDATDGLFIESTTTADEAATINLRGRQDGTDGISSSITFSNFDDDVGAADATANLAMIEIDRSAADDHSGIMTLSTFKVNTFETEHIILDAADESTQINRIMLDRTTQSTATVNVAGGGVYHTSNAGAVTVNMPDSDTYPGAVVFIYCPSATSVTFSASGGDTITDFSTNDNHPLTVIAFAANLWVVKN